jgi:hypothetical protein
MANEFPDPEGTIRAYLRADPDVSAIVGNRVFFGVPRKANEETFPLVTVARIGGADDPSEVPVDLGLLDISCWGSIDASGNGLKAPATELANAVRSALHRIRERTSAGTGTDVFGVQIGGVVWAPDPDNDRPRYVITAEVASILGS